MDFGTSMKCDACNNANIYYKENAVKINKNIEEIKCSKLRGEVKLKTFKELTTCLFYEKR